MKRLGAGFAAGFAVAAVCATSCGTSASSHDGGTGGAAGVGSGGSGGGGGSAASACPAAPPALAAPCTVAQTCLYEDCSDTGRTIARCVDGAWSVETGPCTTGVFCQAETCPVGQICLERIGGAFIAQCVQNTCGTGPIGCDCLQSCAGNTCTVGGSVQSGVTIMCNTCPTNTCP